MANLSPEPQNPPNLPIGPPYTIVMAMNLCGSTTANQNQTFAAEAFMYEFEICKDTLIEDLSEYFKTFSDINVGQGKIRLKPQQKNKIKAFTQWVKYR